MRILLLCLLSCAVHAQIRIDVTKPGSAVPATLHGIFFEEISHAGEGGLYAELIQNRGFEETRIPAGTVLKNGFLVPYPEKPHFMIEPRKTDWKLEWPHRSEWPAWSGSSDVALSLAEVQPLNAATPRSLCVEVRKKGGTLMNEGFWGIHAVAGDTYQLVFYARTAGFKGPLTASLQGADGKVLASHVFTAVNGSGWKKYQCTLKANATDPKAKFVFTFGGTGKVWLDFVSLFPSRTFKNRPNGLRPDIAQLIADLKPSFIRWPGGCYVEGITIESAPDWKTTIGPVEQRPGSFSPWGYWSSDGFGYHEYLQFCEDVGADALYVFNAGVSCEYRSGTYVPDSALAPYIQNALDAIEYAIGPVTSKWGGRRAANGHPKPFPLKYVEVGNEQHGPRYAKRYNVFYDAIRKKYPQIGIIASMGIGDVNKRTLDSMRTVDMVDEHAYKDAYWSIRNHDHFDKYKRGDWEMYVGEFATNAGVGKGNLQAALSDAVYVLGMERNADLVKMSSYAPLLVNVNDVDWPVNLIHFDAARSFGRISYHAIKLLRDHQADVNLPVSVQLPQASPKQPLFAGGIGLGSWDTQQEYKDISVTQNGRIVYQSDFAAKPGEWKGVRGVWEVKDGALAQTAEGPQRFAYLKDRTFDTYTLRLKARKTGGYNAFIIPFAVKDSNHYMRVHIGSWVNSHSVFESVAGGFEVAGITNQLRLAKPIETGRWYDIRLEVGIDKVDCYLDDQLLMTYTEPDKFFAIAGKKGDDVILKVVNASGSTVHTTLEGVTTPGVMKTLTAPALTAENSFDAPLAYVPVEKEVSGQAVSFPPYSISVISIPAAKMAYTVTPVLADTPYYHIELKYSGFNGDRLHFSMPVWTPGYYQLMNYAASVRNFTAKDGNGQILKWKKQEENGWVVHTPSSSDIVLEYDVRSTRPFVAANYLDKDRGYISPAGMFMHRKGGIRQPVTVTIKPLEGWNGVASGMDTVKGMSHTYTAPDFDILYDSPILMGRLESLPPFEVQGKLHRFIAYSPGTFDKVMFMNDLKKIVETSAAVIGDIPYDHYTFLAIGRGGGGIEHLNSTSISFNGDGLNSREGKLRMYNFLAHEYFHHYNVKRIRPAELGPFDYDHGSKTRMLWVSEGFTVYYEYLILRRAGFLSQEEVLQSLQRNIRAYESRPGRLLQSAAAASYETWKDGPFGAGDSGISYYDKGPVLGALLDLKIRHETKNRFSLDDVMRTLYQDFYKAQNRGFTEAEFRTVCERTAGVPLDEYFDYANTVKPLDYRKYFAYAGLDIETQDGSYRITTRTNRDPLQEKILQDWLR